MESTPPRPRPIIEAASASPVPDWKREGKLRLDLNENQWGPSPRALIALAALESENGQLIASYGFPQPLTGLLSSALGVPAEQILLTAGGDEAISLLFEAFIDPGEVVLLPWPTFVTFRIEAEAAGAAIRRVPYGEDLVFPRADYLEAVEERPRLAVIVNPNNPTGTAVDLDFIAAVCRRAPDTLVIADEAYVEYHGETVLSLSSRPANLAVIRTFSKAYGLAGLRIGYIVANPEVILSLAKVRPAFSLNVAGLAAAMAAIEDQHYLASHIETLRKEMDALLRALAERGFSARSSRANFILVQVGPRAGEMAAALERQGILVSDRSADAGLAGTLRITVGRPEQNLKLLAALEEEAARSTR